MIILEKSRIQYLEDFFNASKDSDHLNIQSLILSGGNTRVAFTTQAPQILNVYSSSYLNGLSHMKVIDGEYITFDYCCLWARDISHIFENHVEIEIEILIQFDLLPKVDYTYLSSELGRMVKPFMVYEIENFQHYDLYWYQNREMKIRISNIETLDSIEELIEAVALMVENVNAKP